MATNLQFIKSFDNIASASSVTLTDCFNRGYDVYAISITHMSSSSNVAYLQARFLDSGGSVISASEYDYAHMDMMADTSFGERRNTGQTFMELSFMGGVNYKDVGGFIVYVFNPDSSSSYTFTTVQGSQVDNYLTGSKGVTVHKSAEVITGINFLPSGGTLDEGAKFSVYGVK